MVAYDVIRRSIVRNAHERMVDTNLFINLYLYTVFYQLCVCERIFRASMPYSGQILLHTEKRELLA